MKRDGWILADRWARCRSFIMSKKDPVPIETDPVIQVETVRAAMKKGCFRPASAGGTERDAAYDAGLAALGIPGALPFKITPRVMIPVWFPPLCCFMRALGVPGLDKAGGERGGKWFYGIPGNRRLSLALALALFLSGLILCQMSGGHGD